jgi:lipoprotein-anchoring transpeptidase ErfK/SrfK
MRALASALTLLVSVAPAARSQGTTVPRDPVQAVGTEDSVRQSNSRLRAMLARVARRTRDSTNAARADSAAAKSSADSLETDRVAREADRVRALARVFKSNKDSLDWVRARAVAERADGLRIVVDLFGHQLFVIRQNDTLRVAPVATALNTTLTFGGRSWRFETPRGVRSVLAKEKDPVWRPPDWHFAEVALENGLKMRTIARGQTIYLRDGTKLKIVGDEVGIVAPGTKEFVPLVLDDHIVFDNTIFVPPLDTKHRQVKGELGLYRLSLGDGFLLHGTPYTASIGSSATHGCVRLADPDIEWLYENVPVGTRVYIY